MIVELSHGPAQENTFNRPYMLYIKIAFTKCDPAVRSYSKCITGKPSLALSGCSLPTPQK